MKLIDSLLELLVCSLLSFVSDESRCANQKAWAGLAHEEKWRGERADKGPRRENTDKLSETLSLCTSFVVCLPCNSVLPSSFSVPHRVRLEVNLPPVDRQITQNAWCSVFTQPQFFLITMTPPSTHEGQKGRRSTRPMATTTERGRTTQQKHRPSSGKMGRLLLLLPMGNVLFMPLLHCAETACKGGGVQLLERSRVRVRLGN